MEQPSVSPGQGQGSRGRLVAADRRSAQRAGTEVLEQENARLQALVSELRIASPSVARLADLAVWREREAYEEKTRRVLALLRKKDTKIRELGEVLSTRRNTGGVHGRSAKGEGQSKRGGRAGRSCADASGNGCFGTGRPSDAGDTSVDAALDVATGLERRVREQEDQIEALLEEVAWLREAQPPTAQAHDPPAVTDTLKGVHRQGDRRDAWSTGSAWENAAAHEQAVKGCRMQMAQLKVALSTQAAELAQKGAALDEILKARQQETEEAREREVALRAKVETLERLQEAARRTVLDREEQLRQVNARLCAHTERSDGVNSITNKPRGSDDKKNVPIGWSHSTPTSKESQGFLSVQEWWVHLAATAQKRDDYGARSATRDLVGTSEPSSTERKDTIERLRRLLHDQALEVVGLRQRLLQVEMRLAANAREGEERATLTRRRIASLEYAVRTSKMAETKRMADLEAQVTMLRAQGDKHEALVAAREEITAGKLAIMRAEGDANLHSQLLEEEKQRSEAALSRAEDLQGKLDRLAVAETLQEVPGGVSASFLIDHFIGTALRQSQRVEALEGEVCNMRARCARLARVARGESVEPANVVAPHSDTIEVRTEKGEGQHQSKGDEWIEAAVQDAAVAMESGRRRALEEEIESLRNQLLTQRGRTDALQREVEDERQRRSFIGVHRSMDRPEDEMSVLRRELSRATSEIEALRVHAADLRSHIHSENWSSHMYKGGNSGDTNDRSRGDADTDVTGGYSNVRPGDRTAATSAALKESGIAYVVGGSSPCSECSQLTSLLAERNAQVDVLTTTVEALQVSSTSTLSSPRKHEDIPSGSNGDRGRGRSESPRRRAVRAGKRAPASASLATLDERMTDVDGGVGILNQISAQGLVRHCVALATRLSATMARAWASERRADRSVVELDRKEREVSATQTKFTELAERCRSLDAERCKATSALKRMHAESAVRLREAGEEASKLRSALRDAELGANDAQQTLQSVRDEELALEAELHKARERHRDDINRLSEGQVTRLKEIANRLCVYNATSQPFGRLAASEGEFEASASASAVTPMASTIARIAEQWQAYVAKPKPPSSTGTSQKSRRLEADADATASKSDSERQGVAAAFLQETATQLDNECARAVRRARAFEWELRSVHQDMLDQADVLEELRLERTRLCARVTAAEAALVAASHITTRSLPAGNVSTAGVDNSFCFAVSSGSDAAFAGGKSASDSIADSRQSGRGDGPGNATVAAFSLLEKRLAAALEDLVTAEAARSAVEASEVAATARAEACEAEATGIRATVDVLNVELDRYKLTAIDKLRTEALEWRREIRAEIGRWWQDDLMHLHNGIALDWGSSGATDEATVAVTSTSAESSTAFPSLRENRPYFRSDPVNFGVSGKEAMAQALIAGRVEQAILEERLMAQEQSLTRVRSETLHLRSTLERWHGEFVSPAMEARRHRPMTSAAVHKPPIISMRERLDKSSLAATAELIGAREKIAGLRTEVTTLRALVARVREDERQARETADRRVKSARETVQRRAEGDLCDAAERLAEERERFKLQLGAAHADVLRLGAESAELERRNQQLELERSAGRVRSWLDDSNNSTRRSRSRGSPPGDHLAASGNALRWRNEEEPREQRERVFAEGGEEGALTREKTLREAAEEEREALRRMANGLAIELRTVTEAKAEAEDERQTLVQEAAKAKAEAQTASLAREVQEGALKELGRLLEFAKEGTTMSGVPAESRHGGDGQLRSTGASLGWDRSKEEASRFARVMVAAKVAEAGLLRRLQDASASEAELRHMLRRRDRRIEELKSEQVKTDRLARSRGGESTTPWPPLTGRPSVNNLENALGPGGELAAGKKTEPGVGQGKYAAARAETEISQAATVMRLKLDLAEAAARGDVGDAATSTASRLALRLLSTSGGATCDLCGGSVMPRERRNLQTSTYLSESQQGRGASFLMPSAEIERKAARAEDSRKMDKPKVPVAGAATASHAATAHDSDEMGEKPGVQPFSNQHHQAPVEGFHRSGDHGGLTTEELEVSHTPSAKLMETGTAARKPLQKRPPVLSRGVRSLEAKLARLERDLGGDGDLTTSRDNAGSAVVGDSHRSRSPSSAFRASRPPRKAWVKAVRELRVQMSELHDRAESSEEPLNEDCAMRQELEEEVLRLRVELLRQQRNYWQATAELKDRYERVFAGGGGTSERLRPTATENRVTSEDFRSRMEGREKKNDGGKDMDDVGVQAQCSVSNRSTTPINEIQRRNTQGEDQSSIPGARGSSQQEVGIHSLRESLRNAEELLTEKEQELQDLRRVFLQEAEEARREIARSIGAQKARVTALEEKVRLVREKVKTMARPKQNRFQKVKGRVGVNRGGGDDVSASLSTSAIPLSVDELLNMLAAADEEAFEAKGRAQRAEYDLRALSAEADALRRSAEGCRRAPNVADSHAPQEDCDTHACPSAAGDSSGNPPARVVVGVSEFVSVTCAARLVSAEVEVERLRDECLAASAVALEARREVSALRLATSRANAAHMWDGRAREKKLQKQVSTLKREKNRLRDAADGVLFPGPGGGKSSRSRAEEEAAEAAMDKSRAQLAAAREDSERRSRTITALRAAKLSLEKQLEKSQKKLDDAEAKLNRALKDNGVKGNALQALRGKMSVLEAETKAAKQTVKPVADAPASAAECIVANGPGAGAAGAVAKTFTGDGAGGHRKEPETNSSQETTMRELRAERDRLQANMRARQGLLSKRAAELDARMAELQRMEEQACSLRAAVARKDDAYRTTKKQLLSIRQEYELLKASSQRWQADADIKWRNLKQASESAAREVMASRQTGDAATRELVALKSAFRSFLKTLWDDLLSRPLALAAEASTRDQNMCTNGNATMRPTQPRCTANRRSANTIMNDIGNAIMPASTSQRVNTYSADQGESSQLAAIATTSTAQHPREAVGPGPFQGLIGELSEAEISDIMQALSMDSSSSSDPVPPATATLHQGPESDSAYTLADSSTSEQSGGMAAARSPTTPRLQDEDRAFSARVESALGDRDISAALAKMLYSMRSSWGSWRECVDGSRPGDPLVPAPPPPPLPTPRYPEVDRDRLVDALN